LFNFKSAYSWKQQRPFKHKPHDDDDDDDDDGTCMKEVRVRWQNNADIYPNS